MDQLQQTASLTEDIRDLTQSERDTSVLPDDLDTVNFVFDQVIGLLEETLTTDENITEIPGQVSILYSLSIWHIYYVYSEHPIKGIVFLCMFLVCVQLVHTVTLQYLCLHVCVSPYCACVHM